MNIPFFTARRRRKLLDEKLDARGHEVLSQNVAAYAAMSEPERARLRDMARVLVAEKNWEGCGGLKLTRDMKLVLAAQAALLLVGLNLDPIKDELYPQSSSILVYPSAFQSSQAKTLGPAGIVTEGLTNLGEAWYNGPVVLSWTQALAAARGLTPGHDVTLHEFAHKLDMQDGSVNGTPLLSTPEQSEHWKIVMTGEFNRLARSAALGTPHALNTYGLQSPGEFFAVATEAFFTRPTAVAELHPELYDTLKGYYGQDPAGRSAPAST
jgi:MtfA peptidase